jgi:hypothetical protein
MKYEGKEVGIDGSTVRWRSFAGLVPAHPSQSFMHRADDVYYRRKPKKLVREGWIMRIADPPKPFDVDAEFTSRKIEYDPPNEAVATYFDFNLIYRVNSHHGGIKSWILEQYSDRIAERKPKKLMTKRTTAYALRTLFP